MIKRKEGAALIESDATDSWDEVGCQSNTVLSLSKGVVKTKAGFSGSLSRDSEFCIQYMDPRMENGCS